MEDKDFIPYQEALRLEELGFDEYCMECYYYEWKDRGVTHILLHTPDSYDSHKGVKAPPYQQSFKWFREKHNIDSFVKREYENAKVVGYYFGIDTLNHFDFIDFRSKLYKTYEEAELACLKQLIKIIKEKQ